MCVRDEVDRSCRDKGTSQSACYYDQTPPLYLPPDNNNNNNNNNNKEGTCIHDEYSLRGHPSRIFYLSSILPGTFSLFLSECLSYKTIIKTKEVYKVKGRRERERKRGSLTAIVL